MLRGSGFLCLFLSLLVGCGSSDPDVNYVEGVVTMGGNPVADATVIFSPVEGSGGRPATGKTDAAGVYKLTDLQASTVNSGAAIGEYQVSINKSSGDQIGAGLGEGGDTIDDSAEDQGAGIAPDKVIGMKSLVPDKYTRPDTSGLTATVKAGRNEGVNFDLTAK